MYMRLTGPPRPPEFAINRTFCKAEIVLRLSSLSNRPSYVRPSLSNISVRNSSRVQRCIAKTIQHVSNHVNTRVVRKRRERKTERETEIKKRRRRMEDMRRSRVFARGVACRSRQRWIERDTRRNGTQKERE